MFQQIDFRPHGRGFMQHVRAAVHYSIRDALVFAGEPLISALAVCAT